MSKKTLLSDTLRKRTDTIEYRSIKSQLMKVAQAGKNEFRILSISEKCITQLQNEGIEVKTVTEFNYEKYLLSW